MFSVCQLEAIGAAWSGCFILEVATNAGISLALIQSDFFNCNIEQWLFAWFVLWLLFIFWAKGKISQYSLLLDEEFFAHLFSSSQLLWVMFSIFKLVVLSDSITRICFGWMYPYVSSFECIFGPALFAFIWLGKIESFTPWDFFLAAYKLILRLLGCWFLLGQICSDLMICS